MRDLLLVLDDDGLHAKSTSMATVTNAQREAMRRSLHALDAGRRRERIAALRALYDWPALVAAINVCPGAPTARAVAADRFDLRDLFNLLDMHLDSGHGFRDREASLFRPNASAPRATPSVCSSRP